MTDKPMSDAAIARMAADKLAKGAIVDGVLADILCDGLERIAKRLEKIDVMASDLAGFDIGPDGVPCRRSPT